MSEVIDWSAIQKKVLVDKKIKAGLKAEEVREKLDPEAIIASMLSLVERANNTPIEDLPKLKFQAEVLTTILKKCMPDLRSLEVKEGDNKHATLIIDMKSGN